MANEEHLATLKKGVKVWNQWRIDNIDISPDLSEIKLSSADFSVQILVRQNSAL